MSSWTVVGVVVGSCVTVAAAAVIAGLARRDRRQGGNRTPRPPGAAAALPVAPGTGDSLPAVIAAAPPLTSRRQLLQRGIIGLFVAALAGVVSAALDFLWPSLTGDVGGRFQVGSASEVVRRLAERGTPYYDANGRFYVVPFPTSDVAVARRVYHGPVLDGIEAGFVALSQKCPHLGCRVPWCESSQWFECPCHSSRYNAVGERRSGPAPRGMDHFAVSVVGGAITVDTRTVYLGVPPGSDTTKQPAQGPHCS